MVATVNNPYALSSAMVGEQTNDGVGEVTNNGQSISPVICGGKDHRGHHTKEHWLFGFNPDTDARSSVSNHFPPCMPDGQGGWIVDPHQQETNKKAAQTNKRVRQPNKRSNPTTVDAAPLTETIHNTSEDELYAWWESVPFRPVDCRVDIGSYLEVLNFREDQGVTLSDFGVSYTSHTHLALQFDFLVTALIQARVDLAQQKNSSDRQAHELNQVKEKLAISEFENLRLTAERKNLVTELVTGIVTNLVTDLPDSQQTSAETNSKDLAALQERNEERNNQVQSVASQVVVGGAKGKEKQEYPCEFCESSFSAPSFRTRHLRTHTKDKPFECEVCKKVFPQKVHLQSHSKTHTGEKPYPCVKCEKRFSLKQNLKVHVDKKSCDKKQKK